MRGCLAVAAMCLLAVQEAASFTEVVPATWRQCARPRQMCKKVKILQRHFATKLIEQNDYTSDL